MGALGDVRYVSAPRANSSAKWYHANVEQQSPGASRQAPVVTRGVTHAPDAAPVRQRHTAGDLCWDICHVTSVYLLMLGVL